MFEHKLKIKLELSATKSIGHVSLQDDHVGRCLFDTRLAVWLSGSALASINVVALRQTRLVLGWVTVCERVNHFGM